MDVRLRVCLVEGEEAGEAVSWLGLLAEELGELDGATVTPEADGGPAGSKGFGFGALVARVPIGAVTRLLELLHAFAARTGRTVQVSIGGDSITVTGASREQQDRVIEAWLARHPASS